MATTAVAPVVAPETPAATEQPKPSWKVEHATRIPLLEQKLLELDKAGFWIYKVMCNSATGEYVIVARPKRQYNAKMNEIRSIRKALTGLFGLAKKDSEL